MKYKIEKGTELFDKLTELNVRMQDVKRVANELAKEFGGGNVATTGNYLAGGIDGVEFDNKPEGWRSVGDRWQHLYYPKSTNKTALNKIAELPVIEIAELNKLVGYKCGQLTSSGMSLSWVKSVGMKWGKDFILMETADRTEYEPIEGVVEILHSEYDKLSKLIKE